MRMHFSSMWYIFLLKKWIVNNWILKERLIFGLPTGIPGEASGTILIGENVTLEGWTDTGESSRNCDREYHDAPQQQQRGPHFSLLRRRFLLYFLSRLSAWSRTIVDSIQKRRLLNRELSSSRNNSPRRTSQLRYVNRTPKHILLS